MKDRPSTNPQYVLDTSSIENLGNGNGSDLEDGKY